MSLDQKRRQLLRTGLAGLAVAPFAASAADTEKEARWDRTVDILIVGTGFAGLSAAIEAKRAGANPLVIDKMAFTGGNSRITGGGIAVPGSPMQKEKGIEDSPELMLADMLKAGNNLNHPELARTVAYGAKDAYDWLTKDIGVKFTRLIFHGGHSVARGCGAELLDAHVTNFMPKLETKARELGVAIETRTKLERFIVDEKGRVIGADIRKNFSFGKDESGTPERIRTTKGIVLGSGGFAANPAMRVLFDPRLDASIQTTNSPAATGDATAAAQMIGAGVTQMDWIQCLPMTSPDERGFGIAVHYVEYTAGFGLCVDPATGRRFMQETANRKVRADAILALKHPGLCIATLANAKKHTPALRLQKAMENGSVKSYDTVEALCEAYGMPVEAFKRQLREWNDAIRAGRDDQFGAKVFPDAEPNETGPFLCSRLWPRAHHTMGGLLINRKAEVLNAQGKVIPGLWAAGEATGGVHGEVRLGTVAIADCIVFGRIAGQNAAKAD